MKSDRAQQKSLLMGAAANPRDEVVNQMVHAGKPESKPPVMGAKHLSTGQLSKLSSPFTLARLLVSLMLTLCFVGNPVQSSHSLPVPRPNERLPGKWYVAIEDGIRFYISEYDGRPSTQKVYKGSFWQILGETEDDYTVGIMGKNMGTISKDTLQPSRKPLTRGLFYKQVRLLEEIQKSKNRIFKRELEVNELQIDALEMASIMMDIQTEMDKYDNGVIPESVRSGWSEKKQKAYKKLQETKEDEAQEKKPTASRAPRQATRSARRAPRQATRPPQRAAPRSAPGQKYKNSRVWGDCPHGSKGERYVIIRSNSNGAYKTITFYSVQGDDVQHTSTSIDNGDLTPRWYQWDYTMTEKEFAKKLITSQHDRKDNVIYLD